jgi:hypothetical protein
LCAHAKEDEEETQLKTCWQDQTNYIQRKHINTEARGLKSLGLISCAKKKQGYRCKASEMYSASDLFRKAYTYAVKHYDFEAILSAKYGLLLPDDEIEPYNLKLNDMTVNKVKEWSDKVFAQMSSRLNLHDFDKVFFHTGNKYRQFLIPKLESSGIQCEAPLKNLGIGEQLSWYNALNKA